MFPWSKSVGSFERLGIHEALRLRAEATGHPQVVDECHQALDELYKLERREMVAVIRGENYYTVWSAQA